VKYFIISGSPVYVFRYIGPFDAHKEAEDYQKAHHENISVDWWIAELLAPKTEKLNEPI